MPTFLLATVPQLSEGEHLMMRSALSIQFKPEFDYEKIETFNAELEIGNIPPTKFPKSIGGKLIDTTEAEIIQLELAPDDVTVWFKSRKYSLHNLTRIGTFTIIREW
jgi:hypothetical protein